MVPIDDVDIPENDLRKRGNILNILLKDRTTGRNIIWATDSYITTGKTKDPYLPTKGILPRYITGEYGKLIQPRVSKSPDEQKRRTKDKAEVFTPINVIKQMNSSIDFALGNYPTTPENWQKYVHELRLEITCGEAPFIASRYNPVSNKERFIDIRTPKGELKRVGFLDRKLFAITENVKDPQEWLKWAKVAYKSSYGYEWQGDNLLIARENLLYTLVDFYDDAFGKNKRLNTKTLEEFAEIISWNVFQMDGLSYMRPLSIAPKTNTQLVDRRQTALNIKIDKPQKSNDIVASTTKPRYVKIKDWSRGKNGIKIEFRSLLDAQNPPPGTNKNPHQTRRTPRLAPADAHERPSEGNIKLFQKNEKTKHKHKVISKN